MANSKTGLHALVAEFDSVDEVMAAARAARDAGYTHFDVYSPFPIHGIEKAMGVRPTRLPWLVLAAGVAGTSLALLGQWWMNAVDYPFLISAKPLFGIPANIPITFEFTVLLAAFTAFFGMLLLNRLPEHHHPLFENERFRRATDDGFFLAIEARDVRFDAQRTASWLQALTKKPLFEVRESQEGTGFPVWVKAALASVATLALLPFGGFVLARVRDSGEAPLHIVKDMDSQPRYRAQAANAFFADGRAQRPDVPGAVAFDDFVTDEVLLTGKSGPQFVDHIPVPITAALMARGRAQFAVYCTPCHGIAGYGDGLIAQRAEKLQEQAWVPPSSLHDPVVRTRTVGQLFDIARRGIRTMPGYARQMSVEDSWSVVAYVRALQLSQRASLEDLPPSERAKLEAK